MSDTQAGGPGHGASLSRSGFDAFLTNGAILGLGLFSSVAIARALKPSGLGRYALLVATGGLLSQVLGLQLPVGITYVVAKGRARLVSLKERMMLFALAESLAAAVVLSGLWIFVHVTGRGSNYSTPLLNAPVAAALVIVFVGVSAASSLWRAVLVGRLDIIGANRRDLVVRALQVGLIVAVVGLGALAGWKVSAEEIYAVTVGCAIVSAVLFVRAARRGGETEGGGETQRAGDLFREALRFSIPSYLNNLVVMANYRLDLFILAFFAGVGKVGVYSLAVVVAKVVWLAPEAVSLAVLPGTVAERDHARSSDRAAQGARIALWGSAAACLALAVVSWWAVPLVFGSSFAGSRTLLLLLLPGVWLLSPATVLASFIVGVGKPRANLMVSSVAFGVTLIMDLVLIPTWGATGAALASTASYTVSAVLTVWVFLRLSTASLGDVLIPRRGDLRDVIHAGRSAIARRDIAR